MQFGKGRLVLIGVITVIALIAIFSDGKANPKKFVTENLPVAEKQIADLNDKLANGQIANAVKLEEYLDFLASTQPEHMPVVKELSQELKPDNPTIMAFKDRLDEVRFHTGSDKDAAKELEAILSGTKPDIYNESYIDLLNTVSDLTGKTMPRVQMANGSVGGNELYQNGAGAHLVGNERFGHWASAGGDHTWIWHGALAVSTLYGAYKFSQWRNNRGWSYHNDTGRSLFGSRLAGANGFTSKYSPRTNSFFKPSSVTRNMLNRSCNPNIESCGQSSSYNDRRYRSSHRNRSRSRGMFGGK